MVLVSSYLSVIVGLSNPVDIVYHLQPVMTLTLLPLAFFIDGQLTYYYYCYYYYYCSITMLIIEKSLCFEVWFM